MSLIVKYRPANWDELLGNNSLVNSIVPTLRRGDSRAFLINGPTGCGKTTIARLSAKEVKTEDENIIEVNAAINNGVDDMRALAESLNYKPMRGTTKSIIIDECQAITSQAWKALLKSVEEPPSWVYWFFCTTEPEKVPANIKSRCAQYQVSILPQSELRYLLRNICSLENKQLDDSVIHLCAQEAQGSPRRALTFLAQINDGMDINEIKEIIKQETADDDDIISLAKFLIAHERNWSRLRILMKRVLDQNPETVRRIIESYVVNNMLYYNQPEDVRSLIPLLELFSQPVNSMSPIILACTKWTFER